MTEFYIDGDACPVRDEVIRVAERHGIKINIAGNSWLRLPAARVEIRRELVPAVPDAADDWIAEHVAPFDIVVTSDIPLAARCIEKRAFVVRPDGGEYTAENIGSALSFRELNRFLREIGEKESGGRTFTGRDRSNFLSSLENVARRALKASREKEEGSSGKMKLSH